MVSGEATLLVNTFYIVHDLGTFHIGHDLGTYMHYIQNKDAVVGVGAVPFWN